MRNPGTNVFTRYKSERNLSVCAINHTIFPPLMLRNAAMCHKTGDAILLRYSSSP